MNLKPDIDDLPARVLTVDDERHNRELLAVTLRPKGLVLQTATGGEEALAMIAKAGPALQKPWDDPALIRELFGQPDVFVSRPT